MKAPRSREGPGTSGTPRRGVGRGTGNWRCLPSGQPLGETEESDPKRRGQVRCVQPRGWGFEGVTRREGVQRSLGLLNGKGGP